MSAAATLVEALHVLRADPQRTAVLLDVDGTLAPIVRHADDAQVPEPTRAPLIAVAKRYGLVACISGREAATARRIVALGSIAYVGAHGAQMLRPGGTEVELDPEVAAYEPQVRAFAESVWSHDLQRLRVRGEDKRAIAAYHWRGAPDEAAAERALHEVARRAEESGLTVHWGRKVLEVRPPVAMDKGRGIRWVLRDADVDHALYVGDDLTDLDAFAGLRSLTDEGRLQSAVCIAVRSEESPETLTEAADLVVDGPRGVRRLLEALL